jgi:endo-1,3(4)-beta-glucanase
MIGQAANPSAIPIYSHPFRIVFNLFHDGDFGLHVCYSSDYRVFLDSYFNGVPKGYNHESGSDVIFSAADFTTAPTVEIVDWDDLGLGVKIQLTTDNGGVISTILVEGMAFVTAQYNGLIPRISTIHAILTINGNTFDPSNPVSYTGTKFVVDLSRGQKWVIYSSEPITLVTNVVIVDGVDRYSLVSSTIATDVTIRAALLPDGVDENIYDMHSSCLVSGGSLEIFNSSSYSIVWQTEGDCSRGLLHLGFPQHDEVLDRREVTDTGLVVLSTTRGAMRAWTTPSGASTRWTMNEVDYIPVDGFFPPRDPDPSLIENFVSFGDSRSRDCCRLRFGWDELLLHRKVGAKVCHNVSFGNRRDCESLIS